MQLVGKRLLIVDDEPLFLQTTCQLLQKEGALCQTATDATSALERLENSEFDLILTDLNMPGNLRWELLQAGRKRWAHVPMIVITGVPTLPSAIESLRLGVTDYLLKPVAFPELLASITRTLNSNASTTTSSDQSPTTFSADAGGQASSADSQDPLILGRSTAMAEVIGMIDRIANTNANVLISGETGTGKELIARLIHQRSRQRNGQFLIVDCNTVVEDQLLRDLFGIYENGQRKPGLLEMANGGTVFLDEVAELPLDLQPKLLRVVQNQEVTPVGGSTAFRINVRFISSTQKSLADESAAGKFRNDLYYRLGVLSLRLPPLRERGEDVLQLSQQFLRDIGHADRHISEQARQALLKYFWPGNVRELKNVIVHAATFSGKECIELEDLPVEVARSLHASGQPGSRKPIHSGGVTLDDTTQAVYSREGVTDSTMANMVGSFGLADGIDSSLQEKRFELERVYLLKLLEDSRGNVTHAAQKANMSRQGFHKLLKRHQISAADYR